MSLIRKSVQVTLGENSPVQMVNPIYAGGKVRCAYGKYTITAADVANMTGVGDYIRMTIPIPKGAFLIPLASVVKYDDLGTDINISVGTASVLNAFLAAQDGGSATTTAFPIALVAPLSAAAEVCVAFIDNGNFLPTEGQSIEVWLVYADNN